MKCDQNDQYVQTFEICDFQIQNIKHCTYSSAVQYCMYTC